MGKTRQSNKESKKHPLLTQKEKKAERQVKQANNAFLDMLRCHSRRAAGAPQVVLQDDDVTRQAGISLPKGNIGLERAVHPFSREQGKKVITKDEFDRRHQDQALDQALMDSFPASDPIAVSFGYVARAYSPSWHQRWTWHDVAFRKPYL